MKILPLNLRELSVDAGTGTWGMQVSLVLLTLLTVIFVTGQLLIC